MPKGTGRGSGNPKGVRLAGKRKGIPNRTTFERAEIARVEIERAKGRNIKLGKDILEEFMLLFADIARQHQPFPAGAEIPKGHKVDEAKFLTYAVLARDTARDLANYQSPKFKAIMVSVSPDKTPEESISGANVVTIDDPVALARVYQRRIKSIQG